MEVVTLVLGIIVGLGLVPALVTIFGLLACYWAVKLFITGNPAALWPKKHDYGIDPSQTDFQRLVAMTALAPQAAEHLATYLCLDVEKEDAKQEALAARLKREALEEKLALEEKQPETAVAVADFKPTPITFKPGEPTTFAEYVGQEAVVERLKIAVETMSPLRVRLPYSPVFIGPPGLGKTALAKVTAHEISARMAAMGMDQPDFIAVVGSDVTTLAALDALIRRWIAREGNILFIDEVHTFAKSAFIDKILLLLSERRWRFEGDRDPTDLPDCTLLAGTTDYGAMSGALKRRFKRMYLRPMTRTQLLGVVKDQPVPIEDAAAERIVGVTYFGGAPWEGLQLREDAQVYAEAARRPTITVEDVERTIRAEELDEFGLRPLDRDAIGALLKAKRVIRARRKGEPDEVVYAMSKANLARTTNIDPDALDTEVLPRLLGREFAIVSSRGIQLTDAAVLRYGKE